MIPNNANAINAATQKQGAALFVEHGASSLNNLQKNTSVRT